MVDYHKYDSYPEGYFFINCSDQKEAYYISSKDGKLYKDLKGPGEMQEVTSDEERVACSDVCRNIGLGDTGLGSSGIYYNGTFDKNVNVHGIIKFLNNSTDDELFGDGDNKTLVQDRSIFFDRKGTLIVLSQDIVFLITKDNIYFSDEENYKGPWEEIFSEKKCTKCLSFTPEINLSRDCKVLWGFCPRCGNIEENRDSKNNPVSSKVVLDTLYTAVAYRQLCREAFDFAGRGEDDNFWKKYEKESAVINNIFVNNPSISSVLCGKQWYNVLKKKWNL